jgi:hypothetical protein
MKDVKITVDGMAKTNKLVNAEHVREAIRLCEELREAGVIPAKGVGYRLSPPYTSNPGTSQKARKSRRARSR